MGGTRRLGPAALMGAVTLLTAGCGDDMVACTQMDAGNGIQVTLPYLSSEAPRITIKACADDRCEITRRPTGDGQLRQVMVGGELDSTDPVIVSVVARDSSHHVLFSGRTTVTPVKYQPNGSGCEPTVYEGAAHGRGRHTLTAVEVSLG
jgi:hypothetical protein